MKFKEILIKNKEILQLVYGVVLIVLIPLLIVINTVYIINKYSTTLDVTLQRQALSFGRSVYSLIENDLGNNKALQEKINSVIKRNTNVQELTILEPSGDNFKIIASSDKTKVGDELNFYYYTLAWAQPDNDGLATDSLKMSTNTTKSNTQTQYQTEERFWLVALPISNKQGQKQALATIKLSSKIVDDLTQYNRNQSTYLLILTILVSILFLMINIRLWDYALLYKKIKEVDEMKDEFISMASHELRTPVTTIKGYSSMIAEGSFGKISAEAKQGAERITTSANRLVVLVEDLLNVSRIEQGKMEIKGETQDISSLIKTTIDTLSIQADEKKLKLEYKPHKEVLPMVNIDPNKLTQVLVNLIGNAIKYTEKGSVEFITEENKGRLVLKVKDTGIGMSAEDRKKLFQKFYRVRNEKTEDIGGTGLGLWITKEIIKLMNGEIDVDSIENVGTQVSISFPIVENKG